MNSKEIKRNHRKHFKEIRLKVSAKVKDSIIKEVSKVLECKFQEINLKSYIGIYWPLRGEVDLRTLKLLSNKNFALPSCSASGIISYYPWETDVLVKDSFGIPAPSNKKTLQPNQLGLILVPALSVDLEGYRLGYGSGSFDRLRSNKNWESIESYVVLPKACISSKPLPRDRWDIPFNGWITEEGFSTSQKN